MTPSAARSRRLLVRSVLGALVAVGILGMHGLVGGHAMRGGSMAGMPGMSGMSSMATASAPAPSGSAADHGVVLPAPDHMVMVCGLMLAGGVVLLLRRRRGAGLLERACARGRRCAVRLAALALPPATGPPPPSWRFSVVRC